MPNISGIKSKLEEEIAGKIATDLQSKYQAGTDFNGAAWVPKQSPGQLLVETGETFRSLQASGSTVEIAGKMIYHQDGTSRLPARPIIGVGSEQERIALEAAEEMLEGLLK